MRRQPDGAIGRYPSAVHNGIEDFSMPAPAEVRRAADALRMLADPTRLNILWALMQGESSVACLADLAGTTPTAVSQHLSKLRLAGLVTNRREGTFVYYTLADDHIGELVRQALGHADSAADSDGAVPRATPYARSTD
jgi:DNA-binding transcriptional ArsR family regulator